VHNACISTWHIMHLYCRPLTESGEVDHQIIPNKLKVCIPFEESVLIFELLNFKIHNYFLFDIIVNFTIKKLKNKHTFLKKYKKLSSLVLTEQGDILHPRVCSANVQFDSKKSQLDDLHLVICACIGGILNLNLIAKFSPLY
jgi:hypothetical protein